jgi:hypothetical protein
MNRDDMDFGGLARDLDRKREKARVQAYADKVNSILAERATTHGKYDDDARCAMRLFAVLDEEMSARRDRGDEKMTHPQMHALSQDCPHRHRQGRFQGPLGRHRRLCQAGGRPLLCTGPGADRLRR